MAQDVNDGHLAKLLASRELFDRFADGYEFAGGPSVYVRCGKSFINRQLAERDAEISSRIMAIHGRFIDIDMPFSANEVLMGRNNTRVFAFEHAPDHTAKITSPYPGARILTMEARARMVLAPKLARSQHVFLPSLVEYDKAAGEWLVEKVVPGLPVGLNSLMPFLATGAAKDYYQATVQLRPIGRSAFSATLSEELHRLDPSFPEVSSEAVWPVAMIHGDLDPANLLLTEDGRICVVDLEMARVGPVAGDLANLYRHNRGLKQLILGLLRSLDPTGLAIPPETQLALGIVSASRGHRRFHRLASTHGAKEMLATLRPQ